MEYLSEAVTSTISTSNASGNHGSLLEYLVGVVVAIAVLRLEVMRHAADLPWSHGSRASEGYIASCKKVFHLYVPEASGVAACLALAVSLRIHNSPEGAVDNATYAEIMRQWPILITADTLLSLQAMLRLLVLVSSVWRQGAGPTSLSQEAAVISCGAALGRALLVARSSDYMLDGPLGGFLPVACELLSVPLFAILCRGISRKALTTSVLTLGVVARLAHRNRLNLANDAVADSLFVFAHIAELLAAFAYLSRTLLLDTGRIGGMGQQGAAMRFQHLLMPVQSCLSAYYFVQAFQMVPELVSAGHPFEILQMGGVAQLGAYAAAAVLHLAEYLESPGEEATRNVAELRAETIGGLLPEPMPDEAPQSVTVVPAHVAVL